MKVCWSCGSLLNDSDMFCSICGSKQPYNNTNGEVYNQSYINQGPQSYGVQQSQVYGTQQPQQYMAQPQQYMQGQQLDMSQNLQFIPQLTNGQQSATGAKKKRSNRDKSLNIVTILSGMAAMVTIVVFIAFFVFGSSGNTKTKTEDGKLETDEFALRLFDTWTSGTAQEIMDVSLPKQYQDSSRINHNDRDYSLKELLDEYVAEREEKAVVSTRIKSKNVLNKDDSEYGNAVQKVREEIIDEYGVDVGDIEAAIGVSIEYELDDGEKSGDSICLYKVDGQWYGLDF